MLLASASEVEEACQEKARLRLGGTVSFGGELSSGWAICIRAVAEAVLAEERWPRVLGMRADRGADSPPLLLLLLLSSTSGVARSSDSDSVCGTITRCTAGA